MLAGAVAVVTLGAVQVHGRIQLRRRLEGVALGWRCRGYGEEDQTVKTHKKRIPVTARQGERVAFGWIEVDADEARTDDELRQVARECLRDADWRGEGRVVVEITNV
jgi:hypothetical protein